MGGSALIFHNVDPETLEKIDDLSSLDSLDSLDLRDQDSEEEFGQDSVGGEKYYHSKHDISLNYQALSEKDSKSITNIPNNESASLVSNSVLPMTPTQNSFISEGEQRVLTTSPISYPPSQSQVHPNLKSNYEQQEDVVSPMDKESKRTNGSLYNDNERLRNLLSPTTIMNNKTFTQNAGLPLSRLKARSVQEEKKTSPKCVPNAETKNSQKSFSRFLFNFSDFRQKEENKFDIYNLSPELRSQLKRIYVY